MRFAAFSLQRLDKIRYVFKPAILFLVILFSFLLFLKSPASAQTTATAQPVNQAQQYINLDTNPGVPKNLHTLTQAVLFDFLSAASCQLVGIDPVTKSRNCLGIDIATGKIGYVQNNGGAIGFMGNMIGYLYTPPIHTADYIHYLASNFGIAKSANAQGIGLTSIKPISGLWIVFRNIVYLLFVLVFILIGLGIMLRIRIDPRTVMSVQNQIPKIIMGLIFVTFSFAIAGFLIDAMWVINIVIINVLTTAHPQLLSSLDPGVYVTPFGLSDVLGGFFGVGLQTAGAIGGGVYKTLNTNSLNPVFAQLPTDPGCSLFDLGCYVGTLISMTIGGIVNQVLGIVIGAIVGIFVFLVVIIAVIWALFRLWFALIGAYISILIDIIFAPFWIIGGLLPGAGPGIGFGAWVRDLAANLMAFPVVIGLFLIGKVIADGFTSAGDTFFTPPLIGDPTGNGLGALIAFGIIMISPNVVKMTKAAFKSSTMDTRSIEQGIGVGQIVAQAGYSRFWRGMTKPAGGGASAGPLRVTAAYILSGTRNETTIHERANAAVGRWYNLGGRLNRHRIASGLIGKQEKPVVESSRAGGSAEQG